jgi:hypothetical protein
MGEAELRPGAVSGEGMGEAELRPGAVSGEGIPEAELDAGRSADEELRIPLPLPLSASGRVPPLALLLRFPPRVESHPRPSYFASSRLTTAATNAGASSGE